MKRSIGMWLDTYDDVFSDFDPRPFSKRAISDDFVNEASKMFREDPRGRFEIRLLIPKNLRKRTDEVVVAKRLKQYFNWVKDSEMGKINQLRKNGLWFSVVGFVSLFGAVMVSHLNLSTLVTDSLIVILEPAGWFTVWSGLDKLIYEVPEKRKNLSFFIKMAEGEVVFESY